MGLPHAVLKNFHPMLGRDLHIPWPPGSPAPLPSPVPYVTTSTMMGLGLTCSKAEDVLSQYWGLTMLIPTDIGPMIPHMGPPSNLLAIEIPMSASKSYFGCGRYMSKGSPVAVALLGQTNLNLNCGTPVPTPFGQVIALTTHYMDMSLGDLVSGLLHMGFDFALQAALNKLGSKVGDALTSKLQKAAFDHYFPEALSKALAEGGDEGLSKAFAGIMAAAKAEKIPSAWIATGATAVASFLFGGPLGTDASTVGLYGKNEDGDNRGGPGAMAGDLGNKKANSLSGAVDNTGVGKAVNNYTGDTMPSGYPRDIGSGSDEQSMY